MHPWRLSNEPSFDRISEASVGYARTASSDSGFDSVGRASQISSVSRGSLWSNSLPYWDLENYRFNKLYLVIDSSNGLEF